MSEMDSRFRKLAGSKPCVLYVSMLSEDLRLIFLLPASTSHKNINRSYNFTTTRKTPSKTLTLLPARSSLTPGTY